MFACVLALGVLGWNAPVQSGSASPTAGSRTVLATVVDGRNHAVVDVGVDDFVVKEAGQPREVLDVRVADYPIVLLLDTSAASRDDLDAIRSAAARFVTRIGPRPIVVGTTSPPMLLTKFDDERSILEERLRALTAAADGDSMVLEAVARAAEVIREVGAPFSAIVVVSARAVDSTRESSGPLLTTIIESGAIVHAIGNRFGAANTDGIAARNSDILRALAGQTRGQFTAIYSAASYQIALDRLADRLTTEMMIQYIVPAAATATAASDVKVGVRLPGARVVGLGVK